MAIVGRPGLPGLALALLPQAATKMPAHRSFPNRQLTGVPIAVDLPGASRSNFAAEVDSKSSSASSSSAATLGSPLAEPLERVADEPARLLAVVAQNHE
jgi:hypothetical protein